MKNSGNLHSLHYRLVTPSGVVAEKSFEMSDAYQFGFSVALRGTAAPFRIVVGPGIQNVAAADKDTQFLTTGNGVVLIDDSFDVVQREKAPNLKIFGDSPQYVGIEDNYFLAVLQPSHSGGALFRRAIFPRLSRREKGGGSCSRRERRPGISFRKGLFRSEKSRHARQVRTEQDSEIRDVRS